MSSWGMEPTDAKFVVPLARRKPNDPVTLRWASMYNNDREPIPETGQAAFEHRDGRIWTFLLSRLEQDHPLRVHDVSYYLLGTSPGCEPVRFASRDKSSGKRTVERFANLPFDYYKVLVADAEPSIDHPIHGEIASITITRQVRVPRSGLRHDYDVEYLVDERVGRVSGGQIQLFPTQAEINHVLDMALTPMSDIVERLLAEDSENHTTIRRSHPRSSNGPLAQPVHNGTIHQARRQFGEAAAMMDSISMPAKREERSIQL